MKKKVLVGILGGALALGVGIGIVVGINDDNDDSTPVSSENSSFEEPSVDSTPSDETPSVDASNEPSSDVSSDLIDPSQEISEDVSGNPSEEIPSESEPEVPSESEPEVPSESEPEVPSESEPEVPSESEPEVPSESEPEVPSESEPEVPSESEPEVPSESEPEVPSESEPEVPSESEPEVPSESEPEVPSESEPEVPSESEPEIAYLVEYVLNGITIDGDSEEIIYDGYVTEPTITSIPAEKVFLGWYSDENCTIKFDFSEVITEDIIIYAGLRDFTVYEKLLQKDDLLFNENFDSYSVDDSLASFTNLWGTKGLYTYFNDKGKGGTALTNYVDITNGNAKLVDQNDDGTQFVIDYGVGINNGIVEGYFEITPSGIGNKWTLVQFYGTSETKTKSEVFGLRTTDSSGQIGYRIDGGSTTHNGLNAITSSDTNYEVHYIFDLENKTVTLTMNGVLLVDNLSTTITELTGIKFVSSDTGQKLSTIDNIAIHHEKVSLDIYKEKITVNSDALFATYDVENKYTTNASVMQGYLDTAKIQIENATTHIEVDAAYIALEEALNSVASDEKLELDAAKERVIAELDAFDKTPYTINLDALETALNDGKTAILNATSLEALDGIMAEINNILSAIDNDETVISKAKASAINELEEYKDASLYLINAEKLAAAITAGKDNINNALTIADINNALSEAKSQIDSIPDDALALDNYKTEIKASLNSYATEEIALIDATNYQGVIDDITALVEEACAEIDLASSIDEVADLDDTYKADIDNLVYSTTLTIDELKTYNLSLLKEYADGIIAKLDVINDETLITSINEIVDSTSFDGLESVNDCNALLSSKKALIDDLVEVDNLNKAKVLAKEEIASITLEAKDLTENLTALNQIDSIKISTIALVDEATTVATIDSIIEEFKLNVEAELAKALESVVISIDSETFVISWDAISNATSYSIIVNNEEISTQAETTYLLEPEDSGEYEIFVIANADNMYSSMQSNVITLVATVTGSTQADASINFINLEGYTSNFKDAQTFKVNDIDFNVAASSSNMVCDKSGLKFQNADTSLSFTTTDVSNITIDVYISSADRTMILSGPNGLEITGITKNMATVTGSNYTVEYIGSSVSRITITNAEAGTYSIKAAAKYTVYTQSITIVAPKSVSLQIKETLE